MCNNGCYLNRSDDTILTCRSDLKIMLNYRPIKSVNYCCCFVVVVVVVVVFVVCVFVKVVEGRSLGVYLLLFRYGDVGFSLLVLVLVLFVCGRCCCFRKESVS